MTLANDALGALTVEPEPVRIETNVPGVGYMQQQVDAKLGVLGAASAQNNFGNGNGNNNVPSVVRQLPYQYQKYAATQNPDVADELAILEFAHGLERSFSRDIVRRFVNHVAALTGEPLRKFYNMDDKLLEALHRDIQHGGYDTVPVFSAEDLSESRRHPGALAQRLRANYGLQPRHNEDAAAAAAIAYDHLSKPYWAMKGPDPTRVKLAKTSAWDFICQFIPECAADMRESLLSLEGYCPHMAPMDENMVLKHDVAWQAWASLTAIEHTRRRIRTGKLDLTTAAMRMAQQYDESKIIKVKELLARCGWLGSKYASGSGYGYR